MLKILQGRLQQYVNHELPDVQAAFRKGRETRDQIANIHWIIEKAREFQKTSTSALLTMPKPLTVWITTNWKILKEMGIPDHLTCTWEICMQVRKQQLELEMEQQPRDSQYTQVGLHKVILITKKKKKRDIVYENS